MNALSPACKFSIVEKVSAVALRKSTVNVFCPVPPIRKLLPLPPLSVVVPLVPLASMKSLPLIERLMMLEFDEVLDDVVFDDELTLELEVVVDDEFETTDVVPDMGGGPWLGIHSIAVTADKPSLIC